jgi:hypothetical protein
LQERRDGVGVEHQTFGDVADRLLVLFPKHEHHKILRIGDAQWVEIRVVSSNRESCCRVKAEAKLVVQFQLFVGHLSIYVVHDANIQLYFYIASDVLKKVEKKSQAKTLLALRKKLYTTNRAISAL